MRPVLLAQLPLPPPKAPLCVTGTPNSRGPAFRFLLSQSILICPRRISRPLALEQPVWFRGVQAAVEMYTATAAGAQPDGAWDARGMRVWVRRILIAHSRDRAVQERGERLEELVCTGRRHGLVRHLRRALRSGCIPTPAGLPTSMRSSQYVSSLRALTNSLSTSRWIPVMRALGHIWHCSNAWLVSPLSASGECGSSESAKPPRPCDGRRVTPRMMRLANV